jgi:hypothetical protein
VPSLPGDATHLEPEVDCPGQGVARAVSALGQGDKCRVGSERVHRIDNGAVRAYSTPVRHDGGRQAFRPLERAGCMNTVGTLHLVALAPACV